MIDAYASRPHYWRHLAPVVAALRCAGHAVHVWGPLGVDAPWGEPFRNPAVLASAVLVASAADAEVFRGHRPVVYVEHGAGQTYVDADNGGSGYAGGPGLDHVRLFLCPSERVADRWRAAYSAAAVAVGCPALDVVAPLRRHFGEPRSEVFITAHWRCGVVPETWWALDDFGPALPRLRDALRVIGYELVGHAHPKDARRIASRWDTLGVRFEPNPDVVLARAALLIADNTSLMYEAAALDCPVLALNAKRYRRDVEHGLRFWSHVPGYQCSHPENLIGSADEALTDGAFYRDLRRRATNYTYAAVDGHASDRAVTAIERIIQ